MKHSIRQPTRHVHRPPDRDASTGLAVAEATAETEGAVSEAHRCATFPFASPSPFRKAGCLRMSSACRGRSHSAAPSRSRSCAGRSSRSPKTERFWRDFGFAITHSSGDAAGRARHGHGAVHRHRAARRAHALRRRGVRDVRRYRPGGLRAYVRRPPARRPARFRAAASASSCSIRRDASVWLLAGPGVKSTRCPTASPVTRLANSPSAQTARQRHGAHADRAGTRRAPGPLRAASGGLHRDGRTGTSACSA